MNPNNDGPLPSSANLLQHSPPALPQPSNTLPSARSLGLEFPWHQGNRKPPTLNSLPQIQSSMPSIQPMNRGISQQPHSFQQLPPSSTLAGTNSLSLPSSNKTFQNTPLQGLRTSSLGKRYLDDLPHHLPAKIQKMEKPTVRHPQQQPQQQQHHQQQHHQQHQIQQHQQHLQLLHQQQQHQHQQHQRKVDEVEVTSSAFICRFMDLPGVITLQKLPGCVKLDNQTINCTSLQQQIEMTRQFILEYDRIKSAGNKYQQVR